VKSTQELVPDVGSIPGNGENRGGFDSLKSRNEFPRNLILLEVSSTIFQIHLLGFVRLVTIQVSRKWQRSCNCCVPNYRSENILINSWA